MSHIRFCDESAFQHQDAGDAWDGQEEEAEGEEGGEEEEYVDEDEEWHAAMETVQNKCFNERQQKWKDDIAFQLQQEFKDVEDEARKMGVPTIEWGKMIEKCDDLAKKWQDQAWRSQDSSFHFENIWLCV